MNGSVWNPIVNRWNFKSVACSSTLIIAVYDSSSSGDMNIARSTNGTDWTYSRLIESVTDAPEDVVFFKEKFLILSRNEKLYSSVDGINWVIENIDNWPFVIGPLWRMRVVGDLLMFIYDNDEIWSSKDMNSWNRFVVDDRKNTITGICYVG